MSLYLFLRHSPRRKLAIRQTSLSTPPTEMSPAPSIDISLLGAPTTTTNNNSDINDFSFTPGTNNDVSFSDSSAMILAEARATFARMERESEVRDIKRLDIKYSLSIVDILYNRHLTEAPSVPITFLTVLNNLHIKDTSV